MNEAVKRPARRGSGFALLVTLLLVNGAAMWGQAGWALAHVAPRMIPPAWDWRFGLGLAVAFAVALESVGVFLALSADDADEAGLPAGGIRLASYAVGLVSGGLNLSHWGWGAAGVAFAFLSAISPFLWGVRARIRRNRVVAPSRRLWHPVRSVALIREMAWRGITTEEEALHLLAAAKREAPQESAVPLVTAEAEIELPAPALAPAIERAPRAPRVPRDDRALLLAIDAIKDGRTTAEVAAASGLSAPTVRRYAAIVRTLRATPHAEVPLANVRADVVEGIRTWAKGRV